MIAKLVYIQYLNSKYLIAKLRKYKLSHSKVSDWYEVETEIENYYTIV